MTEYKLVIVGAGGVGKSALTIRFIQDYFVEEYDPTIEDSYRKQISIDNETCILDILDSAGEEEFSAMREQYTRMAQGFLLVFSLTCKRSFDEIGKHYNYICNCRDNIPPIIIVGNKCDLNNERQVTMEDINELCEESGCEYMETSAKERINVDEIFINIVRQLRNLGIQPYTRHNERRRK